MKYTDEQLSRILSAAAVGGLVRFGVGGNGGGVPCCLVQAAMCSASGYGHGLPDHVSWFDEKCTEEQRSDPDAMLRALEERGWA